MSRAWLLAALLAPTVVHAQEATGVVTGIVFERGTGRPLPDVVVRVGETAVRTDGMGRFDVEVPQGNHPVTVSGPDGVVVPTQPVTVAAGQRTEILVTWAPGLTALPAQVESPEIAAEQAESTVEGPAGTVRGRVVSSEDGTPVEGARIYVRGLSVEGRTAADGTFELQVPPGEWELSIIASAFAAQTLPGVNVVSEEVTPLEIEVVPAGLALEAFTVRAPRVTGGEAALLDERKSSTAVADVIGAEQMARTGDSSAAGALRRVTGLTVVGGRFIYVRGLGERYSTTLLNGGMLPSSEPERRVVPLDMFPSSVLESVVIQKTFSPDMPAEFGGGVVQLRTRSFPTEPLVQVILKSSVLGGTTGQQGLTYQGGPTDWLGVDNGTRAVPEDVAEASANEPLKEAGRFSEQGYTAEELEAFGESFSNVWNPATRAILPNLGLQVSLGNGWRVGETSFGVLAAFNFDSAHSRDVYNNTLYQIAAGNVVADTDYDFDYTRDSARMSGLLSLGVKPNERHSIQSTTMVLRTTDNETRMFEGFFPDESRDIRVGRLRWVERMLIVQQMLGEHAFADGPRPVSMKWRYGFAQASRLEPDRRDFRYDYEVRNDTWSLTTRDGDANARFFSELDDVTHDAALDFTIPIKLTADRDVKLKFGGMFVQKDREVDVRRYSFLNKGDRSETYLLQDLETLLQPDQIRPDQWQIKEITQATDNYFAAQTLGAGYLMTEVPATPWLDVMAGARVEHSRQTVTTFELFNPEGVPIVSELVNTDVLPAATLTFKPRDDMRVRMGYGRTVSRPEFRELSPAIFQDVVGGRPNFGNPDLQRATIENADLRWEWFLNQTDVVAVSGFYKYFDQPIEQIVIIGADESLTYDNALAANNFGVEIELRKSFDFVSEALKDMYFSANGSFIQSRIELDEETGGVQTNQIRPLQGQSPWVVNLQLGYDNPETGINAALLYNVFGPRILQVGSFGLPDSYEMPFHSLDFVLNAKLGAGFDVRFTAKNMLDDRRELRLGTGELIEARRPGWSLGLRLGWSL